MTVTPAIDGGGFTQPGVVDVVVVHVAEAESSTVAD